MEKNQEQKTSIIFHMENGMSFKDACTLSGVGESTGYEWRGLTKEERERIEALDSQDSLNDDEAREYRKLSDRIDECQSFQSRCEAARITYKKKLVDIINKGAAKDIKSALEMLRVHFPEDYNVAKKTKVEGNIDVNVKNLTNVIDAIIDATTIEEGSDKGVSEIPVQE